MVESCGSVRADLAAFLSPIIELLASVLQAANKVDAKRQSTQQETRDNLPYATAKAPSSASGANTSAGRNRFSPTLWSMLRSPSMISRRGTARTVHIKTRLGAHVEPAVEPCVAAVSRVAAVFWLSRGVDATRLHQRRRWVVSMAILSRFATHVVRAEAVELRRVFSGRTWRLPTTRAAPHPSAGSSFRQYHASNLEPCRMLSVS